MYTVAVIINITVIIIIIIEEVSYSVTYYAYRYHSSFHQLESTEGPEIFTPISMGLSGPFSSLANTETPRVRSTHGAPLCSKMEAEPAHIVVPCRPFSPYAAAKWTWGNHNHRHLLTPTDTLGIRPWQRNTNSVFYCMLYISTVSVLSASKCHPTQDKGPCLSLEARMSYSLQAT